MSCWSQYFLDNFTEEERREASEWANSQPEGSINRQSVGAYLVFKRAYEQEPQEPLLAARGQA